MKIIEGMKKVKELQEKAKDLRQKVSQYCSDYDYETPVYGADQQTTVQGWIQSHSDILREILETRVSIQKTNIMTMVEIELGGKVVSKSIAEWIHRRRDLALEEASIWQTLGLKEQRMKEGPISTSTGETKSAKIRRYYEPKTRDEKLDLYSTEPLKIDARLEVVNAITDLVA